MKPSPVGVNNNGLCLRSTPASGTLTDSESRVSFCLQCPGQLGAGRDKKSGKGEGGGKHCERLGMLSLMDEGRKERGSTLNLYEIQFSWNDFYFALLIQPPISLDIKVWDCGETTGGV